MHYKVLDLPFLEIIAEKILRNLPADYMTSDNYLSMPKELFEPCWPLVKAIETIRPWSDVLCISIISAKPDTSLPIHIDSNLEDSPWAINIPIYNCDDVRSYTAFYKTIKDITPIEKSPKETHGDAYFDYTLDQVEEIDRLHLTTAMLFNTQVPHRVVNGSDKPRIIISVRFHPGFDWFKYV